MLNCEGQTYFGEEQNVWRAFQTMRPSNWFICSGKGSPEMKRVIDSIDEKKVNLIMEYAGPVFLRDITVNMMIMYP